MVELKNRTNRKARMRGFSVLEILIALAIAGLVIPAVFAFSFGEQSNVLGAESGSAALLKAKALLEEEQAFADEDFNLVNPIATTSDGIFESSVGVAELPDHLTKQVDAYVAWTGDHGQELSTSLSTLMTDLDNVQAPDSCDSPVAGDWTHPMILNPGPSGTININPDAPTGIAIQNSVAYLAGNATSSAANDFFTVDVSGTLPALIAGINTGPGLAAVVVAGNYAYVANQSVKGQLQVIDVSDPKHPVVATSTRLANVKNGGVGDSIFYYDTMIYLGLTASGNDDELNILDVSNPKVPVWKGGYSIGSHAIDALYVKGDYAYLATADSEQLKIINISDPTHPYQVGGSAALPDAAGYGESVDVVGNTVYLGRAQGYYATTKQLYIFDASNPALSPLPILGSPEFASSSVNAISVRSGLAFAATNWQFQVWSLSNPDPVEIGSLAFPDQSTAMACVDNLFYVTLEGSTGNVGADVLKIIGPGS